MAIEHPHGHALPESVIEELLAHPYRSAVITILADHDQPCTVSELATAVYSRVALVGHTTRDHGPEQVRRELYEQHIPKLTATTVLEYNPQQATVEPGPAFESVAHYR